MGLLSKWIESLDYQYEILPTCSRCKSPRSTCSRCIEACELKAIEMKNGVPQINYKKCNECGKCLVSCPVQAIAGIFPKREIHQGRIVIDKSTPPSAKELVVYAKKGLKGIVGEDGYNEQWDHAVKEANEILLQLEGRILTVEHSKVERSEEVISRRELFYSWKEGTQSLIKEMAPAKWRFNQTALELARYYPHHQFAMIDLNIEKCSLCHACEKLCDKKCLEITDKGFVISAQACSFCQLCEDICPEKALTVTEKVSPYKQIEHSLRTHVCSTCQTSFKTLSENQLQCVPCMKKTQFQITR
ncbi:4Fe-4S binding protein [Robertmurraya sp. DFI.2.37]|uniref:4Fe-4S binding protein n=1 Tax=Robertmurraya sp. DFI.2.37 TaxID=3031819 RepID=UPI0012481A81|nr:4Fe-4S binding protein [Robertmurraya sp. DFI.2.37]MDF1510841.1 4Fe-4S binding protein [Robertmurraya sp. DFI.2.37]